MSSAKSALAPACVVLVLGSCSQPAEPQPVEPEARPNILWIVWDTVRADRLGLYGHERDTTPALERWAATARVYDCSAASCWTIPSHASMFTGLHPSEHGCVDMNSALAPERSTVAELLGESGYQTYLFSSNPHVSARLGFDQGFDTVEHPFDDELRERARALMSAKVVPEDQSTNVGELVGARRVLDWNLTAVGELLNERFLGFLDQRTPEQPFFAFLNYMEAHRIRLPSDELRRELLGDAGTQRSYEIDQSQRRFQAASLGLEPALTSEELEVVRGVYDASLRELDRRLDELLGELERRGLLQDTVVILTSDHGEHLGEHGSFLHQYSLYEGVLSVPLVIWAPDRLAPGKDALPASNIELFPTVLELAGVEAPARLAATSLLASPAERALVSEYPKAFVPTLTKFAQRYEDFDPRPFRRGIRSVRLGDHKLVSWSDGSVELYDLEQDPMEEHDLAREEPRVRAALELALERWSDARAILGAASARELSAQEQAQLDALGY